MNFSMLKPEQISQYFADNIIKLILLNERRYMLIQILLRYVHEGPVDNESMLIQVMIWSWTGEEPLLEPMMTKFLMTMIISIMWFDKIDKGKHFHGLVQDCSISIANALERVHDL